MVSSRFQGYCCESGIALCAMRVAWNYAYSPSKLEIGVPLKIIYFRVIETITLLTTRLLDLVVAEEEEVEAEDTNEKLRQPILVSVISLFYKF